MNRVDLWSRFGWTFKQGQGQSRVKGQLPRVKFQCLNARKGRQNRANNRYDGFYRVLKRSPRNCSKRLCKVSRTFFVGLRAVAWSASSTSKKVVWNSLEIEICHFCRKLENKEESINSSSKNVHEFKLSQKLNMISRVWTVKISFFENWNQFFRYCRLNF